MSEHDPGSLKFDFLAAVRRISAANRRNTEVSAVRRIEAQAEGARLAVELSLADSGIQKIWGFGSTFEDALPFTLNSDIDLAVEGGSLLGLYRIAERSAFPVDLVDITSATDAFAERVRSRGRLLFERGDG